MRIISVVIACYYSEQYLRKTVDGIRNCINKKQEFDYQIIMINDGSHDGTYSIIQEICKEDKKCLGINLSKNYGQGAAALAGYQFVSGDIVLLMDDDGQHIPSEMFKLIDKLDEDYDVVYGKFKEKKHSFWRNVGSKINQQMAHIMIGKPKDLWLSSFYVMRPFLLKVLLNYKNPFPYALGFILRSTDRIANVEVEHYEREVGKSGYSLKKLLRQWMNGFTNFSIVPLRIAIVLGILFAIIGFGFGIYAIIIKLISSDVMMGWTSLIAAIFFVGGLLMIMVGMVGEYIGRIFLSINKVPQYVIRDMENVDEQRNNGTEQ